MPEPKAKPMTRSASKPILRTTCGWTCPEPETSSLRLADLHRRGVRAQVQPAPFVVLEVDVERVLHRPRRMVFGIVERGEAVPVGLDLRAVGDFETHRSEDCLDALKRSAHRMDATAAARAAGQADVKRLRRELHFEQAMREAALAERRLDRLLGGVDLGAARLLFLDGQG